MWLGNKKNQPLHKTHGTRNPRLRYIIEVMFTLNKINNLAEHQVLECVGEDSGDTFRIIVKHTSPSHYEALGKVTLKDASVNYQSSGSMTPDLLLRWLDTLLERWPEAKNIPWILHDLDEKTQQFVREVRQATGTI